MRKSLTPAFSTKALVEQESIVQSCIDEFINKVGEEGTREKGLNMTKWFEMLAFDILGEMAFGETFHCIQNGESLSAIAGYNIEMANSLRQTSSLERDDNIPSIFHHADR
jgi:hypothetical protein